MSAENASTSPELSDSRLNSALKAAAGLLFFTFIFLSFILPITDMDSMMHIKTGEYIVKNKTIPRTEDPFSFAEDEVSFLGRFSLSQYWLAHVIIYKVYEAYGPVGLVVFQATIFTLIALVLWLFIRRRGFYLSLAVVAAVSLYLLVPYASVRPQVLSFLFALVLIVLVERYKEGGSLGYLVPLPVIMLLWANMHGGFIYGVVLLFIYIFAEVVGPYLKDATSLRAQGSTRRLKYFLGFSVVAILASAINPNGYNPFVCAVIAQYKPLLGFITEYQSPFELPPHLRGRGYYIYWVAIGMAALLALSLLRKRKFAPLMLVAFSAALTVTALRYVPLFAVTAAPMFGHLSVNPERRLSGAFRTGMHVMAVGVLGFMVLSSDPFVNKYIYRFEDSAFFPANATKFMRENGIKGNIFSSYNQSAYVFFSTYPESRIYLDGRNNNYERIIRHAAIAGGTDTAADVFRLLNGLLPEGTGSVELDIELQSGEHISSFGEVKGEKPEKDWKGLLDDIKADIIVHEAINYYSGDIYPLALKLMREDSWKLVYLDSRTMVFVRDNDKFRRVIEEFEIPKALVLDEIILEGVRELGGLSPQHQASMAIAFLLKGDTGKMTKKLIDRALELDPRSMYGNYAEAVYHLLKKDKPAAE